MDSRVDRLRPSRRPLPIATREQLVATAKLPRTGPSRADEIRQAVARGEIPEPLARLLAIRAKAARHGIRPTAVRACEARRRAASTAHRGRARRLATNTRARGSRRTSATRSGPSEDPGEPPGADDGAHDLHLAARRTSARSRLLEQRGSW